MLQATYMPYCLHFKEAGGTSRGVLTTKDTYFVKIWDSEHPELAGIGEAALFKGLSAEDCPNYEQILAEVCKNIHCIHSDELSSWSSIRFGIESALQDLRQGGKRILWDSSFTQGNQSIDINGLIWMGTLSTMRQRIEDKINEGYRCLKLKIGALDFQAEIELLKEIRRHFTPQQIELRVDANGAFSVDEVSKKLDLLSQFNIHSIEQPIRAGDWEQMASIVCNSPIPIALDEELIGITHFAEKKQLLETIRPHYIILKPSLCGSFSGAYEWIKIAQSLNINYWITSALESNIGLNALAQWCYTLGNSMPQGLGTGQLYTNNIGSPLMMEKGTLRYNPIQNWDLSQLTNWK